MTAPSTLFFDIGNVLVGFDYGLALGQLRPLCARPAALEEPALMEWRAAYEAGQCDRARFVREAIDQIGFQGSEAAFARAWCEIFTPNPPMNRLLRRLRGHRLVHLSNISDLHLDYLQGEIPEFALFDAGIYSFEAGMLKPDPRIFALALERHAPDPGSALYVDDLPGNVEAARAAGIRTWHYHPHDHPLFEAWLIAHGIRLDPEPG